MNEFISSRKVRALFKGKDFDFNLKTIDVNGQKRGCSGFIVNKQTSKVCYINTEPFFIGGLYGNKDKTVMMRTAKNVKDFTGGKNCWLSLEQVVRTAEILTA